MNVLHISLNSGFQGQRVSIAVNGRTVYDRDNVTTDLRISRADAVEVEVDGEEKAEISVSVHPGAGPQSISVDLGATPHLAMDLQPDGSLSWSPTADVMPML